MSEQSSGGERRIEPGIYRYAETMARIENSIVVVSDMMNKKSKIFQGAFADILGLSECDCMEENSIWEKIILTKLPEAEFEAKVIAELRFFHYLKQKPKTKRNYYLITKLRFINKKDELIDVAHKMHYVYDESNDAIKYAVCVYAPLSFDFKGRSMIVNSVTGTTEELTSSDLDKILSKREIQVLSLIAEGKKSMEIASLLNLSIHTINRHRQEILTKLQAKNSIEACRIAKAALLV